MHYGIEGNRRQEATQEDRILTLLMNNGTAWTPAPELSRISLQYCRAINTLRRRGHSIENRLETKNGVRHGFYRLTPITPVRLQSECKPDAKPMQTVCIPDLFSSDELERCAKWVDVG